MDQPTPNMFSISIKERDGRLIVLGEEEVPGAENDSIILGSIEPLAFHYCPVQSRVVIGMMLKLTSIALQWKLKQDDAMIVGVHTISGDVVLDDE